jgi:flagellar FliJ protein
MAFRFTLGAVLKYREALEQRERAALEKAQLEIALLEMQIGKAEEDLSLLEQRRDCELKRGMPAIHLQQAIEQEHTVVQLKDDLTKKREELRLKRLGILKAYEDVRQKRELMERLRERRFAEYTRKQAKAEQAVLDDLFLARHRQGQ